MDAVEITSFGFVMTDSDRLALLTVEHAELLAATRAAVAGDRLGEADPLIYVRHTLGRHGQLPPEGARPVVLLSVPVEGRSWA